MARALSFVWSICLGSVAGAAVAQQPAGTPRTNEELSGGDTTVQDDSHDAFGQPAANLSDARQSAFFVGNSFFKQNWVIATASTAARDGLGPLFNNRSCSACHLKDGRSRPPEAGQPMSTMLLRISIPGANAFGGPRPDPVYGDQIQGLAIPGVPAEAQVVGQYTEILCALAGGDQVALRQPAWSLKSLGYGPVSPDLLTSPRVAPAMIGLGLLEAVPEAVLRELADPDDADHDGISGRLNVVWSHEEHRSAIGRFGWKAEQPTVRQQCAAAFVGDIGITSSVFPEENHTASQTVCAQQPCGGHPEVSDQILADVSFYSSTLAVPARRNCNDPAVRRGQELFAKARCIACHVPQLTTGELSGFPELSGQTIHPYTDLLLHDMGEGLADHRPAFLADGREWRTAPLWGIGLVQVVSGHTCFLHDGRARNLTEAILWHGGEAAAAKETFRTLPRADCAALLAFLESL